VRPTDGSIRRPVRSEPFRSHEDRTAGADSTARPRIAAEALPPQAAEGAVFRLAEPGGRVEVSVGRPLGTDFTM
jgi:hypothetical protein